MKNLTRKRGTEGAYAYLEAVETSSADPIIGITAAGRIAGWNQAAERLYGYAERQIKGKPVLLLMSPGHHQELKQILERLRQGGQVHRLETVCKRKDGTPVAVSVNASPITGEGGRVTGGVLVVRDITRRLRGREALVKRNRELLTFHRLSQIVLSSRSLEQSYRDIVKEIRAATGFPIVAIAIIDEERQTVALHGLTLQPARQERSVLEFPMDQTISSIVIRTGKPLMESHVRKHPQYQSKVLRRTHAETFVGFPMRIGSKIIGCLNLAHTESITISDETVQWLEGLANYVAVLTERKRAEEELRASREQLRELSRRMRSAIEEERKRIAREIHDELGQELSLLQLDLGLIQDRLEPAEKELRRKTRSMSKLIDTAIRSVQKISSDLRPALLDNLGLGAAAEWVVVQFQKRTRIRCRIVVEPHDVRLDPERSTALFRILQEALTNVLRHAKATRVNVRLTKRNGDIQLRIRDNGVGISPERIQDPKSSGLAGMRERVLPWGGSVAFNSKPGEGTEVVVTVPTTS